ncbi:MAG: DUF6624 domain-containing protein [Patescibacteria group bacterium]
MKKILYYELGRDIIARAAVDQKMRERNLKECGYWDEAVDRHNTARLRQIVTKIGWLTVSKVGVEASAAAWLIAQHADHDVAFQIKCLNLMKQCQPPEIRLEDIAYLEDRICVNEHRPQVYGTQFREVRGLHLPLRIGRREYVDVRRKRMGLSTLDEAIDAMYVKYPIPL